MLWFSGSVVECSKCSKGLSGLWVWSFGVVSIFCQWLCGFRVLGFVAFAGFSLSFLLPDFKLQHPALASATSSARLPQPTATDEDEGLRATLQHEFGNAVPPPLNHNAPVVTGELMAGQDTWHARAEGAVCEKHW